MSGAPAALRRGCVDEDFPLPEDIIIDAAEADAEGAQPIGD
jgi:hypothetical protein